MATANLVVEPTRVVQCATCGDAEGWGFMVFEDEAPGPLYVCVKCDRYVAGERQCDYCGRFMRRIADIACPMQYEDADVKHDARYADLYHCPICEKARAELCWFDAGQLVEHQRDHEADAE